MSHALENALSVNTDTGYVYPEKRARDRGCPFVDIVRGNLRLEPYGLGPRRPAVPSVDQIWIATCGASCELRDGCWPYADARILYLDRCTLQYPDDPTKNSFAVRTYKAKCPAPTPVGYQPDIVKGFWLLEHAVCIAATEEESMQFLIRLTGVPERILREREMLLTHLSAAMGKEVTGKDFRETLEYLLRDRGELNLASGCPRCGGAFSRGGVTVAEQVASAEGTLLTENGFADNPRGDGTGVEFYQENVGIQSLELSSPRPKLRVEPQDEP